MFKVRQNLGYATITAPIDGVVIGREVEEGQTVAASFETPTLFTIANDLSRMRVIADVDEADIGACRTGSGDLHRRRLSGRRVRRDRDAGPAASHHRIERRDV